MTIEEIKELLHIFTESGVAELKVQPGDNRIRIRRSGLSHEMVVPSTVPVLTAAAPPPLPSAALPSAPAATHNATAPAASAKPPEPEAASYELVKSPIVGTFYEGP